MSKEAERLPRFSYGFDPESSSDANALAQRKEASNAQLGQ